MNEKERLSALEVALNNEMREREFYLKNANRTKNPLGKKMFQQIGDDELEHYERLKQLHQKWSKQEKWPETVPLKVKDTVVKDILLEFVKKVDETTKGDANDLEAVRTAIDFEAREQSSMQKFGTASPILKRRSFLIFCQRWKMSTTFLSRIRKNTSSTLSPGIGKQNTIHWMEVNPVVALNSALVIIKPLPIERRSATRYHSLDHSNGGS